MDFEPTNEQKNLRSTARRLFQERSTPDALSEIESSAHGFQADLWNELADLGLLGVSTPEELGGEGLGIDELMILVEEVGAAVPAIPFVPSAAIAAPTIEAFGSKTQRADLDAHVRGDRIYTVSGANPSAHGPFPRATNDGDDWRLRGFCPLVPFGMIAHALITPATTEDGIALFVVELAAETARIEAQRVTSLEVRTLVTFDGTAAAPLGNVAHGPEALEFMRARARLAWCGFCTGLAGRALEMTAAYVRERKQFNVPIGSFQAVAQRAADAYIELEAMRLTLARAIHQIRVGEDARHALAVASYQCAEGVHHVTYASQHLHGGVGVDRSFPLFRYYLHGRQAALALGGAQSRLAELGDLLAAG